MRVRPLRHHRGAALAVVVFLGCGPRSDAPVLIEFWAMGREGEVVQRMLPEFERRSPGIRVRVQQIPWSAAHEKLLTAYVGDVMPDIFQVGNTWIPEFVALDAIEPLDPWIAASSIVRAEEYFAGVLETNVIDGRTYGVPWYVDTRLLFYRTDILQQAGESEPPATWNSWLDAMTRVKERAGPGTFAILLPLTEWQAPTILALQLDAELLREHDQYGNFQSRPFRDAFEFYVALFHRGLAPRSGEGHVANLYRDFANGYFSFYISGPWNIGEFQRRLPATMTGKWSTAPMPGPGGGRTGVSIAGGASLAIFRSSRHKQAAWKWIEYLSEPAQQIAFHRLTGDLPARKAAWADEALAENRYAQAFWRQLQHVRSTPKIPEWERIASKIGEYAEAVIRGRLNVEQALAGLDDDVDSLLEKRRWMLRKSRRDPAGGHGPRPR